MNIFITGATGFVGLALLDRLILDGYNVVAAVLEGEKQEHLPAAVRRVVVEPLSEFSDYTTHLQDIDVVIHLAARVHVMKERAINPLQEFRKVNYYGTEQLAHQAAAIGVKRFIFMSTIGVNGAVTGGKPFIEEDSPNPHNNYSVSKYEAENALQQISKKTGLGIVILRAPLVYGSGCPGNFLSLLRIVSKGIPLPFASVSNARSLIYVGNLVDAIEICIHHQEAVGNVFLLSDGVDVSTSELIKRISKVLGVLPRLFSIPIIFIHLIGRAIGKINAVNQLTCSLIVDSSKIRRELGWSPPFTIDEGLKKTAEWFKSQKCKF